MGAELLALGLVERLFQKRAENCGIDLCPLRLGGLPELADFFAALEGMRGLS